MSGRVRYERDGPAAWITMSNPAKANARDWAMLAELDDAFRRAGADDDVHAVVLVGDGDRHFCSGGDVDSFPAGLADALPLARVGVESFRAPRLFPKPVIAAVNGSAIGGGTELTLACDFVVAVPAARFGLPEVGLGIIPPYGVQRLCDRVGELAALDLLLTGRVIDAAEAREIGLVGRVVEPDRLRPACQELAVTLAGRAPLALRAVKTVLVAREPQVGPLAEALAAALFTTADARAAIAAFKSGTPVSFKGD